MYFAKWWACLDLEVHQKVVKTCPRLLGPTGFLHSYGLNIFFCGSLKQLVACLGETAEGGSK